MVYEGPGGEPAGEPGKRFQRKGQGRTKSQASRADRDGVAGVPERGEAWTDRDQHDAVLSPDFATALRLGYCASGESGNALAAAGVSEAGRCAGTIAARQGIPRKGFWRETRGVVALGRVGIGPSDGDSGGGGISVVRHG